MKVYIVYGIFDDAIPIAITTSEQSAKCYLQELQKKNKRYIYGIQIMYVDNSIHELNIE